MPALNRRNFLGSSLAGLAAAATYNRMSAADGELPLVTEDVDSGFDPASLFLTWDQDPTTTMTIQWVGPPVSFDTSIYYRLPAVGLWDFQKTVAKPFPATDLLVHRCQLTGLQPGSTYTFQIGDASPEYRFRTMPAKATNTIQFVSGGDCGTSPAAIASNMIAAKQEPYFALIGGDLAYDNGKSPKTMLTYLQNYRKHMIDARGRLIPMLSCIGNHEVNGGYKKQRADAPHYLSLFDGLFSQTTFGVLDIGDYLSLVLLDTGHIEPIGGCQTDWLEQTLAARQDRPHLIVANHVPAYPSHRIAESIGKFFGTGEENRKHWCPLFEKHKVDAVLEHHDHTFKRTHPLIDGLYDKNGVLYLGDGSWGRIRAPKPPEQRPYLAATSETYHISVHRLEGNQRFHVALEASGKIADVSTSINKRPSRRG